LRASNLGDLGHGSPVNLERALSPSGRLGGHLVQGHIDGTGRVSRARCAGRRQLWLKIRIPREFERYVVAKGSIAIDGISLTVAWLEQDVLAAAIIPVTWRETALRSRRAGDRVNLECDILAKYVEKLLGARPDTRPALTIDRLRELGY